MLKGVRGSDPVNRDALADDDRERVAARSPTSPRSAEMDLNPVFATKSGAIAADVRIVVDWNPPQARYPARSTTTSCATMNRIMKPDAVAVIGASGEAGKIGNSVMKNLINGGYKGKIYPINPSADEIMGLQGVQERQGRARATIDVAVFAIPAKFVAAALVEVRREEDPRRGADPVGLRRDRQRRRARRRSRRSAASTACA